MTAWLPHRTVSRETHLPVANPISLPAGADIPDAWMNWITCSRGMSAGGSARLTRGSHPPERASVFVSRETSRSDLTIRWLWSRAAKLSTRRPVRDVSRETCAERWDPAENAQRKVATQPVSCVRRFASAAGFLLELSCKTFHVKHAMPRLAPRLLMLGWLGATAVSAAMRSFGWGVHVSATVHEKLRSLAITANTPPRTGRASSIGREELTALSSRCRRAPAIQDDGGSW